MGRGIVIAIPVRSIHIILSSFSDRAVEILKRKFIASTVNIPDLITDDPSWKDDSVVQTHDSVDAISMRRRHECRDTPMT